MADESASPGAGGPERREDILPDGVSFGDEPALDERASAMRGGRNPPNADLAKSNFNYKQPAYRAARAAAFARS